MKDILTVLRAQCGETVRVERSSSGAWQLFLPVYHEDGDGYELFVEETATGFRLYDLGLTLMHLSYTYELSTPRRQRIYEEILAQHLAEDRAGSITIEVPREELLEGILRFSQVVSKITAMSYFTTEVVQSLFYEQVADFVRDEMGRFSPSSKFHPIAAKPEYEVDYAFEINRIPVYLFAVGSQDKARITTIACQQFKLSDLSFRSLVVYEDINTLSKADRNRIIAATDKNFPTLDDFIRDGVQEVQRAAA